MPAPLAPLAIVCDFDGTIITADVGDELCRRRLPDHFPDWERRLAAGEFPLVEGQRRIWPRLRITEAEFAAFVAEIARFRDGFRAFRGAAREAGVPFVVASNGFSNYIERVLVPPDAPDALYANRLAFAAGGVEPDFPHLGRLGCASCGVCKGKVVAALKAEGRRVAFLGDGTSDRCAAGEADLLFAVRGAGFERWLRARGTPHRAFETFGEVAGALGLPEA